MSPRTGTATIRSRAMSVAPAVDPAHQHVAGARAIVAGRLLVGRFVKLADPGIGRRRVGVRKRKPHQSTRGLPGNILALEQHAAENSLRLMKTDYLDLVQFHRSLSKDEYREYFGNRVTESIEKAKAVWSQVEANMQTPRTGKVPSLFKTLDTDEDGQIGLYEWRAGNRRSICWAKTDE